MKSWQFARQFCSFAKRPSSEADLATMGLASGFLVLVGAVSKGIWDSSSHAADRVDQLMTQVHETGEEVAVNLAQLTAGFGQLIETGDACLERLDTLQDQLGGVREQQGRIKDQLRALLEEQDDTLEILGGVQKGQVKLHASLLRIEAALMKK